MFDARKPKDQVQRAWRVHGSNVLGRDIVSWWQTKGIISLAAKLLRPEALGAVRDDLKEYVEQDYAASGYAARREKFDEFNLFINAMSKGDLVITVSQGSVYVGTITGDAEYTKSSDGRSNLRRPVKWEDRSIRSADLPLELAAGLSSQSEVIDMSTQVDAIQGLMGTSPVTRSASKLNLRDPNDELAQRLHVSTSWLQECIDLLNDRPQLIFYGPPGTGKTYIAQELAKHVADEHNIKLVQFHPAYSYEDFFEGFRPTEGTAGQVGFSLTPGPLRSMVDRARDNPDAVYVLIIDEINRGNLAKIFGELYFLLEYRDKSVDLLYGSDRSGGFILPRNVIVIGTMNTADRSIALVDAAMRRRFAFVPLHPSEEPTSGVLRRWLEAEGHPGDAADLLDELNALIDDPDFKIGPSYFMRPAVHQSNGLERVWKYNILPLLEEFHYGDKNVGVTKKYGLETIRKRVAAKANDASVDNP